MWQHVRDNNTIRFAIHLRDGHAIPRVGRRLLVSVGERHVYCRYSPRAARSGSSLGARLNVRDSSGWIGTVSPSHAVAVPHGRARGRALLHIVVAASSTLDSASSKDARCSGADVDCIGRSGSPSRGRLSNGRRLLQCSVRRHLFVLTQVRPRSTLRRSVHTSQSQCPVHSQAPKGCMRFPFDGHVTLPTPSFDGAGRGRPLQPSNIIHLPGSHFTSEQIESRQGPMLDW